jgi:hypothetical protein
MWMGMRIGIDSWNRYETSKPDREFFIDISSCEGSDPESRGRERVMKAWAAAL